MSVGDPYCYVHGFSPCYCNRYGFVQSDFTIYSPFICDGCRKRTDCVFPNSVEVPIFYIDEMKKEWRLKNLCIDCYIPKGLDKKYYIENFLPKECKDGIKKSDLVAIKESKVKVTVEATIESWREGRHPRDGICASELKVKSSQEGMVEIWYEGSSVSVRPEDLIEAVKRVTGK